MLKWIVPVAIVVGVGLFIMPLYIGYQSGSRAIMPIGGIGGTFIVSTPDGLMAVKQSEPHQWAKLQANGVNQMDASGTTPILWATRNSLSDLVVALASLGADVNASDASGDTPLAIAAKNGDVRTVEALLKSKANPNQLNKKDTGPLHVASAIGSVQVVQLLIKAGANPKAKDKAGRTPIDYAQELTTRSQQTAKILTETK